MSHFLIRLPGHFISVKAAEEGDVKGGQDELSWHPAVRIWHHGNKIEPYERKRDYASEAAVCGYGARPHIECSCERHGIHI
jgi:hypothetical protein